MDILILRIRVHSATDYAIGHANGNDTYGTFFDSVHDWAGNLRTQGYSRIVSVLLTFQWSDPTFGPPWTRSEESLPPHGNAGTEVEAMFLAERMARKPNLYEILECSQVCRVGPIGMMEARVLGSAGYAKTQTKLLGKAFSIVQWLEPVEREILVLIEEPLTLPELMALAYGLNIDKESILAAVTSLLRRGLVFLKEISPSRSANY